MRARWRIGFGGIALVALALGGCGSSGGGTSERTQLLRNARCDVSAPERALDGLEAGIAATGRERAAGRSRRQILRAMQANVASIRGQLPQLEDCARNAAREAEGKPVHETAPSRPPIPSTVAGHRLGPTRVEQGTQRLPASPCATVGEDGTTEVHLFSDAPHCIRGGPVERLLFVNDTGIGPQHAGAAAVRVLVGDYELWIEPRGSGLIRAPVETYLGRGSHPVRVAGAPGATVLVLPPVCAMHPPTAPGEELCFR